MKKRTGLLVFLLSLFLITAMFVGESSSAPSDRFAYVPSEVENNLAVIDLNTEKVIKTIPTGKTPHAIAFMKSGKAYVNNRGSKDLTVFDANKLEVSKTILLPATSIQLALSPDGKTLAVVYKDALKISLIDTATDDIIRTIPIGKEPEAVFKGALMKHPYWSRDAKYVYASDNINNNIVKIDAGSFEIKATIPLPGSNHYLHLSPDGKLLYAGNETTKTGTSVTIIDSATDKIAKDISIPLEEGEKGLGHHGEFTKDGKYFFVCNEGGRTVAVIDTAKLEVVKTLKAGMGAGHPSMSRDGKYIFVIHHNDNVVVVIDTARQEVLKSIAVGEGKKQAHGSYFSPDGKYFYMINAADNMLVKIDAKKLEVLSKIPVGKSAMYFGIKEGAEFPGVE
ncbi:MAG: cytochrome D1 domain-containing protein [Thermodesulfovibrionales bacterium]|nr:cytochrome D1 domain-containing protein [Thermodesulfovibrionales bacterium]MDP3111507.1 cytochrome D1 domain-containing protein [Thermodesulfovibrionales bacterium]